MNKINRLFLLISVLALSSCGFIEKVEKYTKVDNGVVTIDNEKYVSNKSKNILLFGVDKYGEVQPTSTYYNNEQCDFISILNINSNKKEYSMFVINRDTMCNVKQIGSNNQVYKKEWKQIALSHNEGDGGTQSAKNVIDAVSELLFGVSIDYYIGFKMDAVSIINDSIGGVDVTLKESQDLSAINSSWTKGSTIHLQGSEALSFVRERKAVENGDNLSRMARQQQYFESFFKKILSIEDVNSDLLNGYEDASQYILSDLPISTANNYLDDMKSYTYCGVNTPPGEITINSKTNWAEFIIDDNLLKKQVIELFLEKYE